MRQLVIVWEGDKPVLRPKIRAIPVKGKWKIPEEN